MCVFVCVCNPSDSQFTDTYPVYPAIQYILTHSLRCYRVFPAAPWAKTLILRRDQACTLSYQCLQWRAYSRGTTQLLMPPSTHTPLPPARLQRITHRSGKLQHTPAPNPHDSRTYVWARPCHQEEEEEKEVKGRKAQIYIFFAVCVNSSGPVVFWQS